MTEHDTITCEKIKEGGVCIAVCIPPFVHLYEAVVVGNVARAREIIQKYPTILSQPIHSHDFTQYHEMLFRDSRSLHSERERFNAEVLENEFHSITSIPLHWASCVYQYKIVQLFLKMYPQGVSIMSKGPNGRQLPLHYAIITSMSHEYPGVVFDNETKESQTHTVGLLLDVYPEAASILTKWRKLPVYVVAQDWNSDVKLMRLLLEKCYDRKAAIEALESTLMFERFNNESIGKLVTLLDRIAFDDISVLFKDRSKYQDEQDAFLSRQRDDLLWKRRSGTLFSLFFHTTLGSTYQWPSASMIMSLFLRSVSDLPLLQFAVGSIPLDMIKFILERHSSFSLTCTEHHESPLIATIKAASKSSSNHWEEYYRPIFDLIFESNSQMYIYLVDEGINLSNDFWNQGCNRHILLEAADLGLPCEGIQKIIKGDVHAIKAIDPSSQFAPFIVAAVRGSCLTSVYELFRHKPDVLSIYFHGTMDGS